MRLLNVETYKLKDFPDDRLPRYAILSHTWREDAEEISFGDVESRAFFERPGAQLVKLYGCCRKAKDEGIQYVWIDSCCIDKHNAVELNGAINCMFRWYRQAALCFVFLSDVPKGDTGDAFRSSRWFTRAWTLQELLAAQQLNFYDMTWSLLGNKCDMSGIIQQITGIPRLYLIGLAPLCWASVAQRMSWAANRVARRKEDVAYSLLGIFGINMPLIPGEDDAFGRLQLEIMKNIKDDSILAWRLGIGDSAPINTAGDGPSCLLATSPADFANCGNIGSRAQYSTSENTFEVSNGRLRTNMPLVTFGDMQYGLLTCGPELEEEKVVGIPLAPGSAGEYFRPRGRQALLFQQPDSEASYLRLSMNMNGQVGDHTAGNWRYWFYIDDSVDTGLELIEVHPRESWHELDSMIATSTQGRNNTTVQRYLARFRATYEGAGDFLVVLDFKAEDPPEVRYHAMPIPRDSALHEVSQSLEYMGPEMFGKQMAGDGMRVVEFTVSRGSLARQPVYVVRIDSVHPQTQEMRFPAPRRAVHTDVWQLGNIVETRSVTTRRTTTQYIASVPAAVIKGRPSLAKKPSTVLRVSLDEDKGRQVNAATEYAEFMEVTEVTHVVSSYRMAGGSASRCPLFICLAKPEWHPLLLFVLGIILVIIVAYFGHFLYISNTHNPTGNNTWMGLGSNMAATNFIDSSGNTHHTLFFEDSYGSLIARRWDSGGKAWTTHNITDILGNESSQNHPVLLPGTPLAAASANGPVYQTSLLFIDQDRSIQSVWLNESGQPDDWILAPKLIQGAVAETSSLGAAWLPCGDPGCDEDILYIAADFNGSLDLFDSTIWTEADSTPDVQLKGPGLALAPQLKNVTTNGAYLMVMEDSAALPSTGSGFTRYIYDGSTWRESTTSDDGGFRRLTAR
jgi:hypothetical protein